MLSVEFRIDELLRELEFRNQEDITQGEAAERIGISRQAVNDLVNNRRSRQLEMIAKLLVFFRQQGLDITINDLFREVHDTANADQQPANADEDPEDPA